MSGNYFRRKEKESFEPVLFRSHSSGRRKSVYRQ